MVLFLDTNVLLDFISRRGAFFENAEKVLDFCARTENSAYIASVSVTNCFYILRKEFPLKTTKNIFYELLQILDVADAPKHLILSALQNDGFSDFEDCIQAHAADFVRADYIITRNARHFENSAVPAVTPSEFLKIISSK